MSERRASASLFGSPPTRWTASASFSPPGPVKASSLPSSAPAMARLPTHDTPYSLGSFRQKVDDLDRVPGPVSRRLQRAHHFEPGDDAGRPSKRPPEEHGVGMGAEHDDPSILSDAVHAADEIGARVHADFQARRLEAAAKPVASFEEARREGSPGVGPIRIGDGGERHQVVPHTRSSIRGLFIGSYSASRRHQVSNLRGKRLSFRLPLPTPSEDCYRPRRWDRLGNR